jgi:hypothetical protein
LATEAVDLTVGDAAGSGDAGVAEWAAVARGCGEVVGTAADAPCVPTGSLDAASGTVPWLAVVPWPDISSAVATAATMRRKAVAEAARAVRKLVSSSRELMASRSLVRPAGRA